MNYIIKFSLAIVPFIFLNSKTPPDHQESLRNNKTEGLPAVLSENHADLLLTKLRREAKLSFAGHRLPDHKQDWEVLSRTIRKEIIHKANVFIDPGLPLNTRELGTIRMNGYRIKNIAFQSLPGVYATANLFIPDGKGPFPAVLNMHAHAGRFDDNDQAVGHSLAVNGYVCLSIDPWGAGERTTEHGKEEYHGANLGASFMNIGESLMGLQISDNMRGVDFLSSLPYVDSNNIGATGASGGGNQTMWLAAVDERIKAAVPVVSVGTLESYIMRSNCICELLIDGLTFTEEAAVLALAKAILPINHSKESNPTFLPSEMLRSYHNAKPVFKMLGKENNISYREYDLPHGFLPEDREAMLGWFDLHLKNRGTGEAKKEIPFELLTEEELMVYPEGERDPDIITTVEYCKMKGLDLRKKYLNSKSFDIDQKKKELLEILRINEKRELKKVHQYSSIWGWDRIALETGDFGLIPLLHRSPTKPSNGYVILCDPEGKNGIAPEVINEYRNKGMGIVLLDLTGTGEVASPLDGSSDRKYVFHTSSRAALWLGKTILGEWVKDLNLVSEFLTSNYGAQKITIEGNREAGLAGLFKSALEGDVENLILRDVPLSYLFDNRDSIDFYSMAIHLPDFLNWGDISLAAALAGNHLTFLNPRTMSGQKVTGARLQDFQAEFDKIGKMGGKEGKTILL